MFILLLSEQNSTNPMVYCIVLYTPLMMLLGTSTALTHVRIQERTCAKVATYHRRGCNNYYYNKSTNTGLLQSHQQQPPKKKKKKHFHSLIIINSRMAEEIDSVAKLRSDFIEVLRSRRRSHEVPLTVELGKPITEPMFQETPRPRISEAMESCPKENIENFEDRLIEENLYLITEAGEQGRLPVLILSMKGSEGSEQKKRPAVVFLHSTHKCKEWLRPLLEGYASRGYIAVAIDSRYHGERASSLTTYRDALVQSWKTGDTMPFVFDTAWDLIKLADYLSQREDIDPSRIGITGESLGGMHAWFAAFVDPRYAVVVPSIGVQGFRWAVDNDKWQARVDSIKAVFEEARADLAKNEIDKEVVEKVWDRIAPGLASQFDSPYTLAAIAPRPLLVLKGAEDPRCPLAGLETSFSKTSETYEAANCPENFKVIAQPGIGHKMTPEMVKEASDWFDRFLKKPETISSSAV